MRILRDESVGAGLAPPQLAQAPTFKKSPRKGRQ